MFDGSAGSNRSLRRARRLCRYRSGINGLSSFGPRFVQETGGGRNANNVIALTSQHPGGTAAGGTENCSQMFGSTMTPGATFRTGTRLTRCLAVFGPGLVVMLADTDVGSVITAGQSGVQWGYRLLLLPLLLLPILYVVQELTVRLAIFTGR